jgi:AcrR family transcriptional regulator
MSENSRQRLGRTEARDLILEAAAHVFNNKGRAMTVEDIAQQAGYSTSALYKHFSNKDDILNTLWKRVRQRISDVLQSDPPVELGFVDRARWLLYSLTEFAEQEREIFLAAMASTQMGEPVCQVDEEIMANYKANQQVFLSLMEQGIAEGTLRAADPSLYSMALGGHLHALTIRWAFEGPFPLKPQIDDALELFLRGAAASPQ